MYYKKFNIMTEPGGIEDWEWHYKMGEPSRRLNPHKEQAKELFAKAFALDPTFTPDWSRSPK